MKFKYIRTIHFLKYLNLLFIFKSVYALTKNVCQKIWFSSNNIISQMAAVLSPIEIFIRYQLPENVKVLKYTYPPASGLGDRFGINICLAALAKSLNCKVVTYWATPQIFASDIPSNISKHIIFPREIELKKSLSIVKKAKGFKIPKLTKLKANNARWDHGFDLIPEIQYALLQNIGLDVSSSVYLNNVKKACESIRPRFEINYPESNFFALHLRRGDKIDETIHSIDLETKNIIKNILDFNCGTDWIIFSDDAEYLRFFSGFILTNKGNIIDLPKFEFKAMSEFFIISKSLGVVQSVPGSGTYGGWSSFSSIPAIIGDIPVISCSPIETIGPCRYHNYKRANNDKMINNFYLNSQVTNFLDKIFPIPAEPL